MSFIEGPCGLLSGAQRVGARHGDGGRRPVLAHPDGTIELSDRPALQRLSAAR